jgi:hypothetical protein
MGVKLGSLTLREEHRLNVLENRVLIRIFRPKRVEIMVGRRKLHNEEFRNLYSSLNIIRVMSSRKVIWTEHVSRMGRRGMHRFWFESLK